jgi:gliding motility-associated-like protein
MRLLKLLFVLLGICACLNTYAQDTSTNCPPPNIGFENGTFANWQCDTGGISSSGIINVIPIAPVNNRQTMIDANYSPQLDPYGGFPTLCPYGGTHSIRLGNEQVGARAERVSYTFIVPATANVYDITFYYAVVLQNPNHEAYQQPRFTVNTFDITDSGADTVVSSTTGEGGPIQISCASFDFIASANLPGFKLSKEVPNDDAVFYKDWAPATIHLEGYAGKTMRIEFTTNDCTLGRHFGYAYVDINENCTSPITGSTYCTGQKSVTLLAPGGYGNYEWYTGDLSKQLNNSQALTISPPPPDQTKYAVVLYPFYGLGCQDTIYTAVTSINSGFTFAVQDTVYGCAGSTVDLTAPAVTAGSSSNLTYTYYADSLGTQYLYMPQSITVNGKYYIQAQNPEGCMNILPVQVMIGNPVLKVTNPAKVVYPVTVDLSLTFTHYQGVTYAYFTNAALTIPLSNYQYADMGGTYFIKATDNRTGCITSAPVTVVIAAPPPPIVQAVNTFTPNGDGINDFFEVTITGFGEFNSLRIFNRYGQLVFQTNSKDVPWDGKSNGKPVPTGTYYWLFEGRNTFFNTKVIQGGPITLLR